ncbi:hypothetical protein PRZ48_001966 [Zasmidium cellare]|uniref:Polyketide synthase n=1 Tax=Zasmidium cellare TaxID=395010 RepID=A0ABR0F4K9_ZASCE|nr:hypothetical protein PRZ48_001966 [Zasmidium cellare]
MSKPIAIIGSACRFPGGANSPNKLWELLRDPKDVLTEFPPDRLNLWSFYNQNGEHHGTTDVENQSYLLSEDIRHFDAAFFRIRPSEADVIDPQQRLLLETVYEALESAGLPLEQVQGSMTTVFAGLMNHDYADVQARDIDTIAPSSGIGTHQAILSNRISFFLDTKGVSMTIDTACSSSLVALHQAVQSLRLGESDMAIVVGANLLMDPLSYVAESSLHMLSPDSRCRMWDASANGYARGEGTAAIILKTVDKAIDDGDHIESIIRGSAVNQDGRTAGIAAPSAAAQTALIQRAYQDAGLDPVQDRCHFFEAHGTGTRAGDPVEARGIRDAFFPEGHADLAPPGKLLIGSIKTIIGHLEGCAGLAGVLKASLALQNRVVPPNMHFYELNPDIAPFYDRLEIVNKPTAWPDVADGAPLRVSVNSFGFGGTNAHIVLESFADHRASKTENTANAVGSSDARFVGALLLSANSQSSLLRSVQAHAEYLRKNERIDLDDLSWTLQSRRTHFKSHRVSFSGATRSVLLENMGSFVEMGDAASTSSILETVGAHTVDERPAFLGIFTGQGAQWPSMGRNLVLNCPSFRQSIARCEESLVALGKDAPVWSLTNELLVEGEMSRVHEAAIAHPASLAVQIGLIDLLRISGIAFHSVVGHSSGETAAAYAAGNLSAWDAIRIAYYRGVYSSRATGPGEKAGGMLAAALPHEAAMELCTRPEYTGRIVVAAVNSSDSVTLSADLATLNEVKAELETQEISVRKLKVDKAYHSHHMESVAKDYLESLRACNIQPKFPGQGCIWISSVNAKPFQSTEMKSLQAEYWVQNFVRPVMFAPAVECALINRFDGVIEVGCHPALKGPTTQIFNDAVDVVPPYFSVMRRGQDEVETFSSALGCIWGHLGSAVVDFDSYRRTFSDRTPKLLKGLPSYCWDHERIHWKESRISNNFRLGSHPMHELLGRKAADDTPELLRWRNILRPEEIPWTRDHVFQGQIVLPATAYISAILDAAKAAVDKDVIQVVKLLGMKIPKAVVLEEGKSTELITSLHVTSKNDSLVKADFVFSAAPIDDATAEPEKTCSGHIEIHFGNRDASGNYLQPLKPPPSSLNVVEAEDFYNNLQRLGIEYRGRFRAMKSYQRTLNYASISASVDESEPCSPGSLHPATLDIGLQAILAAISSPLSGQMRSMYLPVGIQEVVVQPRLRPHESTEIQAVVTESQPGRLEGGLQMNFGPGIAVQMEGVELQATGQSNSRIDRVMFSSTKWDTDISSGIDNVVLEKQQDPIADAQLNEAMARTALFYYRNLLETIPADQVEALSWNMQMYWKSAEYWVEKVRSGCHPSAKTEWLDDSKEKAWAAVKDSENSIDILMMRALGEKLPSIVLGEIQPLEIMMEHEMLSRFYNEAHALDGMNDHIARALKQITFRYPQADVIEIGAGVGGTTSKVLRAIGDAFNSYTFTDISSGFFEKAAEKFADHSRKMIFKVCDIEKDPVAEADFGEGGYDVVVAANVLHATRNFADTMRNVWRLLKPGGFLVMMEITGDLLRIGFIMGVLSGWWLGARSGDEGRRWGPGINPSQWHDLLRRTGFSGVDQIVTDGSSEKEHYVSMIVSQAVDKQIDVVRQPLSNLERIPPLPHRLVILSDDSEFLIDLSRRLEALLGSWSKRITIAESLGEVEVDAGEQVSVISLLEVQKPLFGEGVADSVLHPLQALLTAAQSVLWVTCGSRGSCPDANIMTGIARALRTERSDLNLQLLDVSKPSDVKAEVLAEYFVRLVHTRRPDFLDIPRLWSNEFELALDEEKLLTLRMIPDEERNTRHNASRRILKKQVSLTDHEAEVIIRKGIVVLLGTDGKIVSQLSRLERPDEFILDVKLSIPLFRRDSRLFLCYGSRRSDGKMVFTVSREDCSTAICQTNDSFMLETQPNSTEEPALLLAVASRLIVRSFAATVPAQGSVLVYEPPSASLITAFLTGDLWKNRRVYFATIMEELPVAAQCIHLDIRGSFSSLRKQIPADVTTIIDCSGSKDVDFEDLDAQSYIVRHFEPALIESGLEALTAAYTDALTTLATEGKAKPTIHSLSLIPGIAADKIAYPAVVDWRTGADEPLPVEIKPMGAGMKFSSTETHLLVGLSGDLGQSIGGYMLRNGARHIAMASRSGSTNAQWLESMRAEVGADIHVFRMDVTSRESVDSTLYEIEAKMPPVCGVAHGAMVLHDKPFFDMDTESMNVAMRPKIQGSKHLDERFAMQDLDYFVLMSSVASIANNGFQSNYSAANTFMTSLVADRRARGLAACVIHVGVVVDVGYVARQSRGLVEHLKKQGFMLTSEADVHLLFAEGVLASPVDSQLDSDICMGIETFANSPETVSQPPWTADPRLSHFVKQPERDVAALSSTDARLSVKERLDEANSVEDVAPVLQEAFSAKLESLLQLAPGALNARASLLNLGFDSLLAVETRTWFLKEVSVDVPVLRFLSGDSAVKICEDAASQYCAARAQEKLA